ncbi:hypothetical protein Vadar_025453 [Vaccinium darrowii]|uniref:Uncharacterized protein n=1 Tax=Vaccinium darrowii TaxID=229202 RepID=A0ACB7XUQ6_9ERIC|nr:hypothetical protein Vadar_025453 [Vaccinium darrowii]
MEIKSLVRASSSAVANHCSGQTGDEFSENLPEISLAISTRWFGPATVHRHIYLHLLVVCCYRDLSNANLPGMDTREDPFFTTLLQEGSTLGSPYFESPYSSQIFPESQLNVQTEPQPKKSRGVNFTVDEDNMLVSAWLNTSLDAVHGNDQKNHTFWKRIWECYHSHKTFVSERNEVSLLNRWHTIQKLTNKFCGYLAQIESMHQSGTTEDDKITRAKEMYREFNKGVPFQLEHCWNLLKHQPKWAVQCEKNKPKRARSGAALSPELIDPEDDIPNDTVDPMERPTGTKLEKKKKINEQASAAVVVVLNAMQEERKITSEKKLQMLDKSYALQVEKNRIEGDKVRLEQLKEEEKIMTMNTIGMTPMLQEYYHQRQTEILESRRNKN